jgi:hypothetical protein
MTYEVSLKTQPHINAIADIFREEVLDTIDLTASNVLFADDLETFKGWFLEELISDITGFIDQKAAILSKMYPLERDLDHAE